MLEFLDKIPFGTPRLRRILFWLVTTFVAYNIVGFLIIPPIVKSVTQSKVGEALNRTTTIDKVTFNPLTLRLRVEGMNVDKKKGDGKFVSVGALDVSPSLSSIYKLAPVISHLHIRNFALDVTFFGDGKYSVSDLMGTGQPTEDPDTGEEVEAEPVFPFALYGFEMTNATIVFDDRPHEKKHVIEKLDLLVPFTSSFMDQRQEFTKPVFRAVVNGDPIQLEGRTLPFHDSLRTEFELGAVDIDLHQYWNYVPIQTPLTLAKGHFTSDISLVFERPGAKRLDLFLAGGGSVNTFQLESPDEGSVLGFEELSFAMEKFSLGDNELRLSSVELHDPYFKIVRHKDGSINWMKYLPAEAATPSDETGQADAEVEDAEPANPFLVQVDAVKIASGSLEFIDHAVPGGFSRTYPRFALTANNINTRGDTHTTFDCTIGKEGVFKASGTTTIEPLAATVKIEGEDIVLPAYKAYIDDALPVRVLNGTTSLYADVDFAMDGDTPALTVQNGGLKLENLAVHKPKAKKPSLGLTKLEITGASMSLAEKNVVVDQVAVTSPMVRLVRFKSGDIDLAKLFADAQPAKKTTGKAASKPADDSDWIATIKSVKVEDGAASVRDLTLANPANLTISRLKADVSDISTKKGSSLRYKISTRWGGGGVFGAAGRLVMEPLKTNGRLWLRKVGLRPFDGHLGEFSELLFADGSASGDIDYSFTMGKKPVFSAAGTAGVDNVQLKDNWGDGEFAGIDSFRLNKFTFANEPYRVSVAEIMLDGPRANIEFNEEGRLNIRRAFRLPEPAPVSDEEEDDAVAEEEQPVTQQAEADTTDKTAAAEEAEPEPFFDSIEIGKVTMENGAVTFMDSSVQPEYTTSLSEMHLALTDIAQDKEARPKVDFSAKIGPTPMSVTGTMNPVINPIFSDLAVAVNGMELVPMSPYTVQHLAYPIEKGRLYADVTFKTEDNALSAENKFFIEQLVLGPKDTRPDAPSIPVKFGLALLQDGNGDMELNLPIRGNLDDPDFRIGGIVFKAIASLFIKALASPFSLIGSIFGGGGEDMNFVLFQPGRNELDPGGISKLETTIKALTEREKLKLEVDGVIDPVADKNGLVDVIFETKVKQQKFNSLSRKERAETTVDEVVVAPEEYEEFLFEAYAEEPDEEGVRPTTLFMVDEQPVEVMEKFIRDRIVVEQADLNELAMRRAKAVKDFIIERNPELTDRVFLLDRREDSDGKTGVPNHRADLGIK